jgi:hypothetical protein
MADIKLEGAVDRFKKLGNELEKLISSKISVNDSLASVIAKYNQPSPAEVEVLRTELVTKQRELKEYAPLFGDRSTLKQALELNQIHQKVVDVQKAMRMGIVDIEAGEEQLAKLRHEMSLAELKAHSFSMSGLTDEQGGKSSGGLGSKLEAGATEGINAAITKVCSTISGEAAGIAEGLLGLSSALPVAGGLFGLLMYGVKEHDRLQQQSGALLNVVSAYGAESYRKSIAWLDGFQERAQKFYGISRGAVLSIVSQYVNAGVSLSDFLSVYDASLGEVGTNAVTATLALDRTFELANGFTARGAIAQMRAHGYSMHDAVSRMALMESAVAKAGLGVERTITWALQAAQNVRRFGIDAQQLVEASIAFSRSRRNKGLGQQTGVAQGLSEFTQGLSSLSTARELWMAEQLGYGKGLLGRWAMRDMLKNVDSTRLLQIAKMFRDEAVRSGGDETNARFFLERQGFGFEGARAIYELGDLTNKDLKLSELDAQALGNLRSAFVDEGSKVSENQRKLNAILASMRTVAQTSMSILSDAVAFVIVGVESLPYIMLGTGAQRRAAYAELERITGDLTGNAALFWSGLKSTGEGIGQILEPHIRPIVKALVFDPKVSLAQRDAAIQAASDTEKHTNRVAAWQNPVLRPVGDAMLFGAKTVNQGLKATGADTTDTDKWGIVSDQRIQKTEQTRDEADSNGPHSMAPVIKRRMHPGADSADSVRVQVTVAYG